MICSAVKKDGTPCKGTAKKDGLCIAHQPRTPKAEVPKAESIPTEAKPAFLQGMRRARSPRFGQRRIKMLRPICDTCTSGEAQADWYRTCSHDPYVGKRQTVEQVPIYSEPNEDGSQTLLEVQDRYKWSVSPNFVQITVANSINSGDGEAMARAKGYIGLDELRSPAFPAGIAPMCQFRNCFWQHDLVAYKDGVFCRKDEAKRVAHSFTNRDSTGSSRYGAIEVLHVGKMNEQYEKVVV